MIFHIEVFQAAFIILLGTVIVSKCLNQRCKSTLLKLNYIINAKHDANKSLFLFPFKLILSRKFDI